MDKKTKEFLKNELKENGTLGNALIDEISKDTKQLVAFAAAIEKVDFRIQGKIMHKASTIMLLALMGAFAGAHTWCQIATYGKAKMELLRQYFPNLKDVPSHDTLRRFFMIVDSTKLEMVYREWARNFQGEFMSHDESSEEEEQGTYKAHRHYSLDGKTIRNAIDPEKLSEESDGRISIEEARHAKLHMVSAYDTEAGISMAQERVNVKENELAAIPKLLNYLDLGKGDIVTIDAMGTHANLAELITSKGADYLFEVKDNQPKLKEHIEMCTEFFLKNKYQTAFYDKAEETLYDHSMTTKRECYVYKYEGMMRKIKEKWPGMNTFGVIITTRTKKDGTSVTEKHYYITSLPTDPKLIMKHKREHWKIENALHWHLDVIFNEDKGRKMMNSAQNYSVLTKMALAILKKDKSKMPMTDKRLLAGWNDNFMKSLIDQFISSF